jgi:hypothetical protein
MAAGGHRSIDPRRPWQDAMYILPVDAARLSVYLSVYVWGSS